MKFSALDRRVIYAAVLVALSLPLLFGYTMTPNRMRAAEKVYDVIETLDPAAKGVAFIAMDFGPNTIAENGPQAEVVIEHLMRRRIPIASFTTVPQSEAFLNTIPERIARRLTEESKTERWEYGTDWVNLGYRPGGFLVVQAIPKAENPIDYLKRDVRGNNLKDLPAFKNVKSFKDIPLLAQFTGYVGVFDNYVQFFQTAEHKPKLIHGCTSITIPEAYIYLDSGQLQGLLEGLAGGAWYSEVLKNKYPARAPDSSALMNTGLGIAHLVIIALIIIGNVAGFLERKQKGERYV